MKALSVSQPWASLIACGAKRIETRSWCTTYRGPLAIHASKQLPRWALYELPQDTTDRITAALSMAPWTSLPRGGIIAIAELTDVLRTGYVIQQPGFDVSQEKYFGDFTPGRFAWFLKDVQPLHLMVPLRGYQGLWDLDPGSASLVLERAGVAV